MLRNRIGPEFSFRNCVFFCCFFGLFFKNPLFFCRENEIFENKKKKKMDQFLTLKRAKIGPAFNFTAYIYIFAVESKRGPKIAFFESKLGPMFLFFFFVFFQNSSSFCRENEILQKTSKKDKNTIFLSQNLVQFCCATYLDQVLTQPWTKF